MQIEINPDLLFEMAALVYHRWSQEYDLLKQVKAEKDDGSPDWAAFHKRRLAHHTTAEAVWAARKDEASKLIRIS